MRKLYLFFVMLCALLGTQTASAWTVYLYNNSNWEQPAVHAWNNSGVLTGSWGDDTQNMTWIGNRNDGNNETYGIWVYTSESGTPTGLKFYNSDNTDNQTGDCTFNDGHCYYSNATSSNEAKAYYMSSALNWDTVQLTRTASGTYTYSNYSTAAKEEFKAYLDVHGMKFYFGNYNFKTGYLSGTLTSTGGNATMAESGTYDLKWQTVSGTQNSTFTFTKTGSSEEGGDTTTTTWTVYFDNTVGNWDAVYAYVWDNSNSDYKPLGNWVGTQISYDSTSGYYKCTFTANSMTTPKIIFNNNGSNQTADLELKNNWVYSSNGAVEEYDGTGTGGGEEGGGGIVGTSKYSVVFYSGTTTYATIGLNTTTTSNNFIVEDVEIPAEYSNYKVKVVDGTYTYTDGGEVSENSARTLYSHKTDQLGVKLTAGTYTITLIDGSSDGDNGPTVKITFTRAADPETEQEVSANLNMPLKRADFANGPRYFVVGTRMSEWRLQPEWELLDEDGDGTYTLNNRLMYTGMMGIAKVESFEDYIFQRYTFYAVNTAINSDASLTLSKVTNPKEALLVVTCAESANKFTAINYGKSYTHNQFTESNTIVWGSKTDLGDTDILEGCGPTYVQTISIKDNGDSGIAFTVSGASTDAATIANYRTFSLVGSAVNYAGAEWEGKTPLRNDSEGPTDWQEAWIQYDNYGKPYYDAYGNTMYQTVFQREWLKNHPTMFKAEDGFEYNSLNIVFNYDSAQTHDATIPASGEEAWTTSGVSVSSPNKSYEATVSDGNAWQCFVVENMWLEGEFKVWTGWGGADKNHDGSGTGTGDARWYYENGGHHIAGDWTISANKNVYYATDRDINSADFDLSSRIFARYVKVWWDPKNGFDNSFIQLITEVGGPEISCERVPDVKHQLQYTWTVPYSTGLENYSVKNIRIDRYRIDAEGYQTVIENVYSKAYNNGELVVTSSFQPSGTDVVDPNEAEGGYYWYKIYVDYYGNESAEEKTDFTRDAESNRVYIYYETIPDKAIVKQLAYNEAAGTSEAADDAATKYWSFDLRLTASAPVGYEELTAKNAAGEDVELLSLVDYYVVGVPKAVIYNGNMTVKNAAGTDVTYETFADKAALTPYLSTDIDNYNFDVNYYYGVAPDADNGYAMPTFEFENVVPGSYRFYVSMGASDGDFYTDGTDNTWATYNVASAYADVEMVKPVTKFSAENFGVKRIDGAVTLEAEDESVKPYGSKNAAITYTKANKVVSTDGQFDQLMVTNGVLEDWEVKYYVTLEYVDPTDASTEAKAFKYYSAFNDFNQAVNPVALNSGALTATLEYLPMATTTADKTFNEAIGNLSITQPSATGYEMKASTRVDYTRRDLDEETGSSSDMVSAETMESTATVLPDGNFAAYAPNLENATRSYQVWGGWDGSTASYYYDAFANMEIEQDDAEKLYRVAGFYANTTGRPVEIPEYENCTKNDGLGGEAIGGAGYSVNYTLDGYDPADATKSHPAAASAAGKLPFAVHYAGEAASADEANPEKIGTMYVVVTADYPIEVKAKPTLSVETETLARATTTTGFNSVEAESGSNAKSLQMVTYPVETNSSYADVNSTDIEDVVADGDGEIRIYPNPAVDVVTVAGAAALGTVEIYSLDGRLVKVVEAEDYSATIAVGDLAKGIYVVRAGGLTERMIKM